MEVQTTTDVEKLEDDVWRIQRGGREFIIVGTAHVSKKSAELAESTIEKFLPNVVCVELCEDRLESIRNPEKWKNTDIKEIIKGGRLGLLIIQLMLASFQKKVAEKLGVRPGEEMKRSIDIAQKHNIKLACVDRSIKITFKRAWETAGAWSLTKLCVSSLFESSSDDSFSESELEKLKEGDALAAMMAEFGERLPKVKTVLIDERDVYLSTKIWNSTKEGERSVSVLGAGHLPGVLLNLGKPVDLRTLEESPGKSFYKKFKPWIIPLILVFVLLGFGFRSSHPLNGFWIWALSNALGATIFAAVAVPHPLTLLTIFVIAPLAALHPLIGVGIVAAFVEAYLRSPLVGDFEKVTDEVSTVKSYWTNRILRLFLIMVLSSLGSISGSIVGIYLASQM